MRFLIARISLAGNSCAWKLSRPAAERTSSRPPLMLASRSPVADQASASPAKRASRRPPASNSLIAAVAPDRELAAGDQKKNVRLVALATLKSGAPDGVTTRTEPDPFVQPTNATARPSGRQPAWSLHRGPTRPTSARCGCCSPTT